VVDTLRADRLQPYGCARPTSPTLQALADRGVVFEDVTAQGSWTKPSMVSLLHGKLLTTYRDNPLEDAPTMAELFRVAGYRTLAVVGNQLLDEDGQFDRGFERFVNVGGSSSRGTTPGEVVVEEAAALLEDAFTPEPDGSRQPVFAWFHLMEPHAPYDRHPEYEEELPTDTDMLGTRRETFRALVDQDDGVQAWMHITGLLAAYDQEVRKADHFIQVLLDEIARMGRPDQTLVAVVSDHGEGLWQRALPKDERRGDRIAPAALLHSGHGKVVDMNLVATPMILAGPGIPAGLRVGQPVRNVDLLPTLLELCAIAPPASVDGHALGEAMRGAAPASAPVYTRVLKERALRDPESSWRLVVPSEGYEDQREVRLHDALTDPLEVENAAASNPEVVARLRALLEEVEATYSTPTSLGRVRSQAELKGMAALGYTGDDG